MKTDTMRPMADFIAAHGITATATRVDQRPDSLGDAWDNTARHFVCTLRRGGNNTGKGPEVAKMTVCFSQGSAHTKPPTCAEVLDCLAMDAAGIENSPTFVDWCAEYGYDTDSRKAEKTFRACSAQRDNLKAFMGAAYEALLWETERL